MLPEQVMTFKKNHNLLTVTYNAGRDQYKYIQVAHSKKHCTIHLFCNYEKAPWAGLETLVDRSLETPSLGQCLTRFFFLHDFILIKEKLENCILFL